MVSEDNSRKYRRVIKAIVLAIEEGEKKVKAPYRTLQYALKFGFEEVARCNRQEVYKNGIERLKGAIKSGQYNPAQWDEQGLRKPQKSQRFRISNRTSDLSILEDSKCHLV